jgi:BASS family bile acid:Na+ symporter
MDVKQIVMLAIQVSILSTVFGFGLNATREDLLYLLRQPRLLARSLLAVFVILPIVAVALAAAFDFPQSAKIVLVALALSPVPPLLPRKEAGAGGQNSYALGLMAILAIVSIVGVPLGLEFLQRVSGRELGMPPGTIAGVVVTGIILPLLAGMAVRTLSPALAERIVKPVALIARLLLPVAVVVLFASAVTSIWALVGDGTVLSMVILTVAGLAIGHVLGGPLPRSTVRRHHPDVSHREWHRLRALPEMASTAAACGCCRCCTRPLNPGFPARGPRVAAISLPFLWSGVPRITCNAGMTKNRRSSDRLARRLSGGSLRNKGARHGMSWPLLLIPESSPR